MGEKLVIGKPATKGLRKDVTAFNIDNDSFPTLTNAYQWRGRVKRKRGTSLFGRLQRFFNSNVVSYTPGGSVPYTITFDGSGNANLLSGIYTNTDVPPKTFSLQTNGTIVPGSVIIVGSVGGITYTDPTMNGYLTPTGTLGPNTINYSTGAILIPAQAGGTLTAIFIYNPALPVMGIEDLILTSSQYPNNLFFDTDYAYTYQTIIPFPIYDVSFYKNPPASGSLPGYVPKAAPTPTSWNGEDYQQFWTTNYQGALWATNGIATGATGFDPTNIGMQFKSIHNVAINAAGPPANITFDVTDNTGLVVGDFVFVNEVIGMTGLNFQTGYITNIFGINNIGVVFPNATVAGVATLDTGILQLLTNRSDKTKDCLRWYDGDPTNSNPTNPTFVQGSGWVNFAPPLSEFDYSIADLPADQYYLVGARMIATFKDRLVFFGPVIQTSGQNAVPIYLQDTFIYSQNGTPYYTVSFSNPITIPPVDNPTSPDITFYPILLPINQTATAPAYFEDQTGFGGFLTAGVAKAVLTVSPNEDVLICGFSGGLQTRMVYSGNDIVPFNLFIINSELGSESTFSIVNMDQGVLTRGTRGYIITNQTSCQRIDLEIPDQVFEISLSNNGSERVTAQRDFINEWIYFTYPSDEESFIFPNQTLLFNYRDNSWAIFNECYTTYGQFKAQQTYTWATIGLLYETWSDWNVPWNAGSSQVLQPRVLAGNQQGFILIRDDGTGEGDSLSIQNISSPTVTSPNHGLNLDDYIIISGVLGDIGANVNGNIYSLANVTTNTFDLNPIPATGTYLGGGLIKRMYKPDIRTKQFPIAWDMARKTRLGPQQYLLTQTPNGQVQLLMFLSQDDIIAYNDPTVEPNDSLLYSTVLYTCRESTNLGLTAANTNLQQLNAIGSTPTSTNRQQQIWHRINTSLIGDTVQLGITLSDSQMRDTTFSNQFEEIEIHGMILDVSPSQVLS